MSRFGLRPKEGLEALALTERPSTRILSSVGAADAPDPGGSRSPDGPAEAPLPRDSGSMTLDPLIGRVILERYEVLRRIGSGGMGSVYVGQQLAVGREVALKVLRQDLINNEHIRQRFRREAEIVGKLRHPNTVQLIDYGETDHGLAVMVMELLHGHSLSERLKAQGALSLEQTLELGEAVAGSLAEAHTRGLVHRDLKPANIFLAEVGATIHGKVLDFGIARLLDEEATRLTSTGQVFGTPRYMSPEQALSAADVDPRSDLYSLGLILYECLVGEPPFVAQTSIQYLSAHTTQEPPKLREEAPDAPEGLEVLIDACLAKDPDERPSSAEEVGNALRSIRTALATGTPVSISIFRRPSALQPTGDTGLEATYRPSAPTEVANKAGAGSGRGSRWVLAAASGMAVLVAAWVAFVYLQRERPAPVVARAEVPPVEQRKADAGDGVETVILPTDRSDPADRVGSPRDAGMADQGEAPAPPVADPPGPSAVSPPTVAPSPRKARPRKQHRPRSGGALVGPVTEGPRSLVIPDFEDEKTDLVAQAASCRTSDLTGLSRLTTRRCPADCAVILDDHCAGRTPAADRPVPPGRRIVSIVCDGKLKRRRTLRFREDQTRVFRCR